MSNNGDMNVRSTFQFTPLVCTECNLPIGVAVDRNICRNDNILCLYCASSLCLVNEILKTNFYPSVDEFLTLFNKQHDNELTFYRDEEMRAWRWFSHVKTWYWDQLRGDTNEVVIEV